MTAIQVPQILVEKVEAFGGYLIKYQPEETARGFILSFELVSKELPTSDRNRVKRVEFFFPNKELAEICGEACSYLRADSHVALPGRITKIEDYFRCSFCAGRPKESGVFFRNEEATAAVCERCVEKFSADIAAGFE